jgi:hypothetical protein
MMMLDGFVQMALYGRSFWVGFGAQELVDIAYTLF